MTTLWPRITLHFLSLLPALWLGHQIWLWYNFAPHDLSANPIEYIMNYTGDWTIRFLLLTLSITPLASFSKWRILKYRRLFGLYAFFYALLHFLNYMVLDYFFNWMLIIEDILKRPAITIGMVTFIFLIPLAATSTKSAIKNMGKNWRRLHQLIYLLACLGIIHNYMMVKADVLIPIIYAIILFILLGYRISIYWKKKKYKLKKQLI